MIDHTAVNVSDHETAKDFYSKALEPLKKAIEAKVGHKAGPSAAPPQRAASRAQWLRKPHLIAASVAMLLLVAAAALLVPRIGAIASNEGVRLLLDAPERRDAERQHQADQAGAGVHRDRDGRRPDHGQVDAPNPPAAGQPPRVSPG